MPSVVSFVLAAMLPAAALAGNYTQRTAAVTGTITSVLPVGLMPEPVYASVIREEPGTTEYALQCGCSDPKTATKPCTCAMFDDMSYTLTAGPTSWAYKFSNAEHQVSTAYNCSAAPEAKTAGCFEYLSAPGYLVNKNHVVGSSGYSNAFIEMIITAGPTAGAAATKSGSGQASPTSSSMATRNMGESIGLAGAVALGAAALVL